MSSPSQRPRGGGEELTPPSLRNTYLVSPILRIQNQYALAFLRILRSFSGKEKKEEYFSDQNIPFSFSRILRNILYNIVIDSDLVYVR